MEILRSQIILQGKGISPRNITLNKSVADIISTTYIGENLIRRLDYTREPEYELLTVSPPHWVVII